MKAAFTTAAVYRFLPVSDTIDEQVDALLPIHLVFRYDFCDAPSQLVVRDSPCHREDRTRGESSGHDSIGVTIHYPEYRDTEVRTDVPANRGGVITQR